VPSSHLNRPEGKLPLRACLPQWGGHTFRPLVHISSHHRLGLGTPLLRPGLSTYDRSLNDTVPSMPRVFPYNPLARELHRVTERCTTDRPVHIFAHREEGSTTSCTTAQRRQSTYGWESFPEGAQYRSHLATMSRLTPEPNVSVGQP
jgi:hypothetical protein